MSKSKTQNKEQQICQNDGHKQTYHDVQVSQPSTHRKRMQSNKKTKGEIYSALNSLHTKGLLNGLSTYFYRHFTCEGRRLKSIL